MARPARRHDRPRLAGPRPTPAASSSSAGGGSPSPASTTRTSSSTATTRSPARPTATPTCASGSSHSPEPRVLDAVRRRRLRPACCPGTPTAGSCGCPFYGALVTNCGIDRDRARWLHRWPAPGPARHLAARLGRPGHQPVRAGAVRLPAGGDAAHPGRPATVHPLGRRHAGRLDCVAAPRGVAQLGSARRSGRRGRRFKSCHPDFPLRGRRWRPLSAVCGAVLSGRCCPGQGRMAA